MNPNYVPFPWILAMDRTILAREGTWMFTDWRALLVVEDTQERLEAFTDLLVRMKLCRPREDQLHEASLQQILALANSVIMTLLRSGPCTSWEGVDEDKLDAENFKNAKVTYRGRDCAFAEVAVVP
jgi:hypothetical protein